MKLPKLGVAQPPRLYGGIMIDAPWGKESGGGKVKRGADRHYKLIKKKEDIRDVILQSGVWRQAENSHLYMWATNTTLEDALWISAELGFRYKTNFPWVKPTKPGIGQYARGKHELLLFCVRGRGYAAKTERRDIATDFLVGAPAPTIDGKQIHSAKPERAYELMRQRTVGPYLSIFERFQREGFDVWGDEAPKA